MKQALFSAFCMKCTFITPGRTLQQVGNQFTNGQGQWFKFHLEVCEEIALCELRTTFCMLKKGPAW